MSTEDSIWRKRENERFLDGTYTAVPWCDEQWWHASNCVDNHYAHVSEDDSSKLAYTPDDRFGRENRQLRVKPGRYLNKFFSDVLTPVEIAKWAGKFAGENEKLTLLFATTPDDIESVYVNGPNSCMVSGFSGDEHPCRAYGAGDLAVAYIDGTDGDPTARAVCWPEKKVYSTIYGDSARLAPLLDRAGFSEVGRRDFDGARLLKIPSGAGFCAPYVDGAYYAADHGDHFVLGQSGMALDQTSGVIGGISCERCNEYCCEDEAYYVDHQTWCESCYENAAIYCERCEENTDSDGACEVNVAEFGARAESQYWCSHCADSHATSCDHCHEKSENVLDVGCESWCYSCWEDHGTHCERCESDISCDDSTMVGSETWCTDCAKSDAFECVDCLEKFPTDDKREFGHGPHCSACADIVDENQLDLFDGALDGDALTLVATAGPRPWYLDWHALPRAAGEVVYASTVHASIVRAVFVLGAGLDSAQIMGRPVVPLLGTGGAS